MIDEEAIALMASTAYSIPSLFDFDLLPIIDRSHVIKMIDMFMDEAITYIDGLGVEPLPAKYVKEDAYILCDDLLNYIGEFEGGLIPQQIILTHISRCGKVAMLHSHPIPIPIPTVEDVLSSLQIGYRVECIISKSSDYLATMLCLEPLESWNSVASALHSIGGNMLESTKYIVIGDGPQIEFLPFPNIAEQSSIIQNFIGILSIHASVLYARIDLVDRVYDVEILNRS
ncbi:MAG: hypothetical protein N3D82_00030 [Ignisphaera sp.]|nr:hypothetical protein [Ignisphaera sp.]MCX8167404.1 hypothetical protein [Ignisphaera sp.]MDW8085940.1 hypothetical protein [Ignisphaera sp.]